MSFDTSYPIRQIGILVPYFKNRVRFLVEIMKKLISLLCIILFFNIELIAMEKRPYHHLPDGTF